MTTNSVKMNAYGMVLTGREYGKNAAAEIFGDGKTPHTFDFSGVASVGSSFVDEIFKAGVIAGITQFDIIGANKIVQFSLKQAASDLEITLHMELI